jgi:hypothetical protein
MIPDLLRSIFPLPVRPTLSLPLIATIVHERFSGERVSTNISNQVTFSTSDSGFGFLDTQDTYQPVELKSGRIK